MEVEGLWVEGLWVKPDGAMTVEVEGLWVKPDGAMTVEVEGLWVVNFFFWRRSVHFTH